MRFKLLSGKRELEARYWSASPPPPRRRSVGRSPVDFETSVASCSRASDCDSTTEESGPPEPARPRTRPPLHRLVIRQSCQAVIAIAIDDGLVVLPVIALLFEYLAVSITHTSG